MSKVWKTLIIDDEQLARQRLKRLLKPFDELDIIGEAANGQDGLEQIQTLNPDLIFLDIEMPLLNGFEMLAKLDKQPKVVFTTAYDQYAIKAFEEDSIDYLLKPVEAERLEKTIKKLGQLQTAPPLPLEALMKQLMVKKDIKTLTVKIGDRILLIKLNDILFIDAEEKYVFLHTADGKKHLTDFTISSLEDKLPEQFIRIHRGTIINADHIKEIRKGFNGALIFLMNHSDARLTSSRSNGDMLRERFGI
ncbi:LytR/AlgR family response regulator transcription factor [Mucilaginibacter myungsuensis]|uniref:LytTR family transcriptional regulator DNA-binding domain-containing protein n=1 Tax=Mucilaginibacter myungsuensis TaxID=649104 RepID=A0A929KTY8_9SPHI|nr:response regulator [Mucilaginibacter myungsuensis]MBE9661137.1 LytTR family transcriptional regulator DNA-binding domain-containing protein [Mucilaginibacter myungsuensis]MDN3597282.1 LytTR family transcriptional regulator DNA-binding domain-containing protein [Mucilaginibacter myungsuensis]